MLRTLLLFLGLTLTNPAFAEQGCPAGQIPAQANGSIMSCGPIPPGYYQQQEPAAPRPSGKWLKTWGAVAVGMIDSTPRYGVPVGLPSKSDAEKAAMARCLKAGAQNCRIATTFRNQCMAIGEPQVNGVTAANGVIQFSRQSTEQDANSEALRMCVDKNPSADCKVIYVACSQQVFQKF
ncbi:DUF4189 domain-containing protein [Xanthomonas campestris pv. asclepiadis]|uniref:DUF4189 domain-containing protein n=1 Tax=Xanthomonas campestris TaxID=339 RepID=UPI001E6434CF|nr:DUF4189 domain-containing protein [Xanthomonas campestris]MCC4615273.1 DUF4189 domain-containing protein [Xanthomonas campestris pv. asclepiadis]